MKKYIVIAAAFLSVSAAARDGLSAGKAMEAMKKAVAYLYEEVSLEGGFVWNYSEDLSQRWGELEAWPTMVWVEKSTPAMGQLMLDAYHATGDGYYYDRAVETARILIRGQLPCGGWNYKFDLAGAASEKKWYRTIGKNAWGMGEHSFYYGNATYDDNVTAGALDFLIRIYLEKLDPQFKPAVEKGIDMLLDSQLESGGWPQRWPLMDCHPNSDGTPDYSSCTTFNDNVTVNNIDLLLKAYFVLGDNRAEIPLYRAMDCVRNLQQGFPSSGWADQYYSDGTPAKARDFEPAAVSTTRTKDNILKLIEFYYLTGDTKYLSGIPAAIDFLKRCRLDDGQMAKIGKTPKEGFVTCPRFIKPGTMEPLFLHREGQHVNNGRYWYDDNIENLITHYASVVTIDVGSLESWYGKAASSDPSEVYENSPLSGNSTIGYRKFESKGIYTADTGKTGEIIASLDRKGRWISELTWVLMPYVGEGDSRDPVGTCYADTEGSPYNTAALDTSGKTGISIDRYMENISTLIAFIIKKEDNEY